MSEFTSLCIRYSPGNLMLLDQTVLPLKESWIKIHDYKEMIDAIQKLKVRGAPAIGIAAGFSLLEYSRSESDKEKIKEVANELLESRPTAVNLKNVLDRLVFKAKPEHIIEEAIFIKMKKLFEIEVEACDKMASFGSQLVNPGEGILTHCNTGGLATPGIGTALGVIIKSHREGKKPFVYVDETRPLLQGGRLTTYELSKNEVQYKLICDNMAGYLMSLGKIQKVFVGADRIAANGDFANKIGTYSLAVLAKVHKIPFYVVAPESTIDPDCKTGEDIPIEERKPEEVKGVSFSVGQLSWSPEDALVYNPAFDVTKSTLVTGLITSKGLYSSSQLLNGDHLI